MLADNKNRMNDSVTNYESIITFATGTYSLFLTSVFKIQETSSINADNRVVIRENVNTQRISGEDETRRPLGECELRSTSSFVDHPNI